MLNSGMKMPYSITFEGLNERDIFYTPPVPVIALFTHHHSTGSSDASIHSIVRPPGFLICVSIADHRSVIHKNAIMRRCLSL